MTFLFVVKRQENTMNNKIKNQPAAVAEAREHFVYVIVAMMLIAGTTEWFGAVFSG